MTYRTETIRIAAETLAELDDPSWATPLERVGIADSLVCMAGFALGESVRDARKAGATWAQIGGMLDITRQAAQQRFLEWTI